MSLGLICLINLFVWSFFLEFGSYVQINKLFFEDFFLMVLLLLDGFTEENEGGDTELVHNNFFS